MLPVPEILETNLNHSFKVSFKVLIIESCQKNADVQK